MATTPWCASLRASLVSWSRVSRRSLHARIPARLDQLLEPQVLPLPGNANVIELPRPGAQRLLYGMQAEQDLHASSLDSATSR